MHGKKHNYNADYFETKIIPVRLMFIKQIPDKHYFDDRIFKSGA